MPRYTEYRDFPDIHSDMITHVAFNPDGRLLASASLDGTLCISSIKSSLLCHQYFSGQAVLSMIWADNERIICGLKDGTIACLVINSETKTLDVTATWGHSYPIEVLAVSNNRLASGAHGELFIWRWNYNAVMSYQEREVTFPDSAAREAEEDVVVTALHWSGGSDGGSPPSLLIVGYMHHGIRIFETQRWGEVRHIPVDGLVGSTAVSPDDKYIAVSNMFTGFCIYRLDNGDCVTEFEQEAKEARPVPVTWLHGGRTILGGSTISYLSIWYYTGHNVIRLSVPGNTKVLGIAAHYNRATNTFLVACGTETEDRKVSAIIWRAKKCKDAKSKSVSDDDGDDNDENDDDDDDNNNEEESTRMEPVTRGMGEHFSSWSLFVVVVFAAVVALQLPVAGSRVLHFGMP